MYSVPVADVDRQLTLFIGSPLIIWPPRCMYVGYGRYSFVDIMPRARAYLGVTSDYKRTLRTDWGRALHKTNMKKSGSAAYGSKDENQKTMNISNSWLIN